MTLVPRLLCDWLTYSCVDGLLVPATKIWSGILFFSVFLENYRIFQWFDFDFGEFSQNLLFVCLLQKVCNFGSFEKCYPEHFVFILFFLRLIVCCFDVPFSIGQRRSYIIPCISVDDFKMALSSKDLSEHERILHHTLPILINIIGVLDILCQFRQFSFAEHMACR